MSRKKTENVNEDTMGNEIVTSDQPSCTTNCIYFVKRTIGDQSLMILGFFGGHLSVLKGGNELLQGR